MTRASGAFLRRRRGLVAAGLTAFALPSFARRADSGTQTGSRAFDAFVIDEMRRANIPGLALGSARKGAVRLLRGYGEANIEKHRPVTARTVFHLASVTKTVTATAIVQLAEDGRLSLDDPVAPRLDFPLANPNHPNVPITFRHLLTHTSSLSDEKYYEVDFRRRGRDATLPLADFLRDYLVPGGRAYSREKCFSRSAPGATWDYCNVGYGLLGYLGSRIGGEDMRERIRKRIFAPLTMRDTHWTLGETPAARTATPYDIVDGALEPVQPIAFPDWGAGMLRSSMADFIRFVAACANGGSAFGARIVKTQTMARMLDMQTPAGLPDWLSGQGLGWMASPLNGTPTVNHWGGDPGVFTAVYIDPKAGTGVALFANTTASTESKAAIKNIAGRLVSNDIRG